jgi:hypothetical protein
MKLKLETDKGWTEAIIDDDCGYENSIKPQIFYRIRYLDCHIDVHVILTILK